MEEDLKKTGYLFGGNAVFVEELYRQYLANPASVDQTWQEFFAGIKDNSAVLNKSTAKIIIPYEIKKEPLNNNLSSEVLNNRHLAKPAYREEFKGDTEYSTAAYIDIREDASTGSTYKLPLEAKFGKMSIDFILLYSQNSAKTFLRLLLQNNLLEYLQDSLVVAISLKVANIVRPFIKNVVYCDDQNPNDIIKLLSENAKI